MAWQRGFSRSARKRKARRVILDGFPILEKFQSIDDARKYVSEDRIVCLLCGKRYKKLPHHIRAIHNITCDEYREKYRIPWTYSLICSESSAKHKKAIERTVAAGKLVQCQSVETLRGSDPIRRCPFKEEVALQNKPLYTPKLPRDSRGRWRK